MFIHHADILKTNIEDIWRDANCPRYAWSDEELPNLHILGNLPFNIASPLIIQFVLAPKNARVHFKIFNFAFFRLLRQMSQRRGPWAFGRAQLTLTFQYEVALRICAPIDTDERTRISVVSQYVSQPELLFVIPGAARKRRRAKQKTGRKFL